MRNQMKPLYQLWKGANVVKDANVVALKKLATGSKGGLLLESVIVVLVFTLVGAAVLSGLSITQVAGALIEKQSAAENMGRNEMEYIMTLPYQAPPSFYPTLAVLPGYSVVAEAQEESIEGAPPDPNLQKIVVTVSRDGEEVLVLESFRTNAP